jgi:plasmid stabilization system protein ParE
MQRLRAFPQLGQQRDDLAPGLRALSVETHVLYDQIGEGDVTILRVLHGHMDAPPLISP